MRIGILGSTGRLGTALMNIETIHSVVPIYLDVSNYLEVQGHFEANEYDAVINCAAITDVNACQKELLSKAVAANVVGALNVRSSFSNWLIQISSDFVFDGKQGHYSEKDKTNPINSYGMTKMLSEEAVSLVSKKQKYPSTIIRTTQLYGQVGKEDFLDTATKNYNAGKAILVADNLYGNPTHVTHLAESIMEFVSSVKMNVRILNLSGSSYLSRYEFIKKFFEIARWDLGGLSSTTYDNLKVECPRPLMGGFNLSLAKSLGLPLYSAEEGIALYLKEHGLIH